MPFSMPVEWIDLKESRVNPIGTAAIQRSDDLTEIAEGRFLGFSRASILAPGLKHGVLLKSSFTTPNWIRDQCPPRLGRLHRRKLDVKLWRRFGPPPLSESPVVWHSGRHHTAKELGCENGVRTRYQRSNESLHYSRTTLESDDGICTAPYYFVLLFRQSTTIE